MIPLVAVIGARPTGAFTPKPENPPPDVTELELVREEPAQVRWPSYQRAFDHAGFRVRGASVAGQAAADTEVSAAA